MMNPLRQGMLIAPIALMLLTQWLFAQGPVEKWDMFTLTLPGPEHGNPFTDITIASTFTHRQDTLQVDGFYDGNGIYKVRFMPVQTGRWRYTTHSNDPSLDQRSGSFLCVEPGPANHGPVGVSRTFHFAYADGSPFLPLGTTCYAWVHQPDSLQRQTLQTLAKAPFNKLRMTVFPKYYAFNRSEPSRYPYEKDRDGNWDFSRFNPAFFQHLETQIVALQALGIEVDLILFHPYDHGHWGFDQMGPSANQLYLKYVVARFSAYRNLWWSMANEYDLMADISSDKWEELFLLLAAKDPYQKLTSIHNGDVSRFYDHTKPYITHVSLQYPGVAPALDWKAYQKPVINDECEYEGNLWFPWGNLTAEELLHRAWLGYAYGVYVGHGETYQDSSAYLWWSHGGELKGKSPERLRFLQQIMYETSPYGLDQFDPGSWLWERFAGGRSERAYLYYFGNRQPANWLFYQGEAGVEYRAEVIDPWHMTLEKIPGTFRKDASIPLPEKPRMVLRIWEVDRD